MKHPLGIQ